MEPRVLDWRPPPGGSDPRNWHVKSQLRQVVSRKPVNWLVPIVLDQQRTGMCVGYGWTNFVQSSPAPKLIAAGIGGDDEAATPDSIYDLAQRFDGSAPDPSTGASVQGGANGALALKLIRSFSFAHTVHEIAVSILTHGPVVMGTNWYDGMFTPDTNHRIRVSGPVAGGHCYLIHGYDPNSGLFRIRNSWGTGWGARGDAFIGGTDLGRLLSEQGEACVPSK